MKNVIVPTMVVKLSKRSNKLLSKNQTRNFYHYTIIQTYSFCFVWALKRKINLHLKTDGLDGK